MTDSRTQKRHGRADTGGFFPRSGRAGYSLVEVLVAAAIVAVGVAAAAILAMTMVAQQEVSARVVRALNYQEQACRLFQLGVTSSDIGLILPSESAVTSLTFSGSNVTVSQVGTVQMLTCTAVIASQGFGSGSTQTNVVAVIRPSIY